MQTVSRRSLVGRTRGKLLEPALEMRIRSLVDELLAAHPLELRASARALATDATSPTRRAASSARTQKSRRTCTSAMESELPQRKSSSEPWPACDASRFSIQAKSLEMLPLSLSLNSSRVFSSSRNHRA